jgi:hypothetical protein
MRSRIAGARTGNVVNGRIRKRAASFSGGPIGENEANRLICIALLIKVRNVRLNPDQLEVCGNDL